MCFTSDGYCPGVERLQAHNCKIILLILLLSASGIVMFCLGVVNNLWDFVIGGLALFVIAKVIGVGGIICLSYDREAASREQKGGEV